MNNYTMDRSSSRIIITVFVIAVCVCAAFARPGDAKVANKMSVAISETLSAPPDKALDYMRFLQQQRFNCRNGEVMCDPTGQKIEHLDATANYKPHEAAKDKVITNKQMNKLNNLACYYSIPTDKTSKFLQPAQIDATLCSHLIVASAQVQDNKVYFKRSFDMQILREVVKLREKNPKLKVLLSIIHFSNGSHSNEGFPGVVANIVNLEKFVNNVVLTVNQFHLDGIDIDWEFPSWPLFNSEEKYGFSKLLETLRYHLPNSILTAAVAAPINIIKKSYDIYSLASFLDFINVMAYDYYSYHWYFPLTGPNSPLFSSQNQTGYIMDLNVNSSIQYYISKGMPIRKILLGMPTYGHSYKLTNEHNHGFYSPSSGPGIGEYGFVTFSEACEFSTQQNVSTVFDHATQTPYSYHKNDWISYDNEQSLAFKAELATSLGLGGAMIFSLNTDDYNASSLCSSSVFPLTSIVKLVLDNKFSFH